MPSPSAPTAATSAEDHHHSRAGQLALFRHGGYGATVTTVRHWCPSCGWDAGEHRTETRPDR